MKVRTVVASCSKQKVEKIYMLIRPFFSYLAPRVIIMLWKFNELFDFPMIHSLNQRGDI